MLCHLKAIKSVLIFYCAQDVFKPGFIPYPSIHSPAKWTLRSLNVSVSTCNNGTSLRLGWLHFQQDLSSTSTKNCGTSIWKMEQFTKYLTCQLYKIKCTGTGSPLIWCNFTTCFVSKERNAFKTKNGFPFQFIWR